jgi:GTP pyrophosphokinase
LSSSKSDENKDRFVNVWWTDESLKSTANSFEAAITVTARRNFTILAKITNVLADMKVAISSINTREAGEDEYSISLVVVCKNLDHLKNIVSRLGSVENVTSVRRSFT